MSHAGINNSNPSATPTIPTSFVVDIGGPAVPSANVLDILGGVGIQTSAVGNVLTISNTAIPGNLTFNTNSTPATSSLNTITFTGSGGLLFSGAGSTVTGALANIPNSSLTNSSITITAGTGLAGGGLVSLGSSVSLNLSTPVTVPNGGTGTTSLTDHGVLIGQGTGAITTVTGSTGQVLQANTGANPTYSTATYPSTTTINQVLYSSAANTVSGLSTANNSILLTSATGVPSLGTSLLNDFTFTSATAAATRTLTISNTDNTNAASIALSQITTGGASSGDPFQTFTVTGATSWSHGIDNSVSDNFVLAASTALGTTNVMSATTGGAVSFVLGNVDVTKSASGATVSTTVSNTSNTGSSNALQQVTVAGTSAGDAFTTYTVSGTTNWSIGTDNSVTGDPFVIAASTALGTTNIMSALTSGEINYPLQPAFLAGATNQTDVTGDGTAYTVTWATEIFDQGNDFDGTSTFTAPVTGKYHFNVFIRAQGILSTHTLGVVILTTTARNYNHFYGRYSAFADVTNAAVGTTFSTLADMTACDTCIVVLQVSNGTKVVDVNNTHSRFSGMLVC